MGLGKCERVGKAHSIETLNCHWNTLVHARSFLRIGCAKRGSSAYFCNEAVSLVWQGIKSLYHYWPSQIAQPRQRPTATCMALLSRWRPQALIGGVWSQSPLWGAAATNNLAVWLAITTEQVIVLHVDDNLVLYFLFVSHRVIWRLYSIVDTSLYYYYYYNFIPPVVKIPGVKNKD